MVKQQEQGHILLIKQLWKTVPEAELMIMEEAFEISECWNALASTSYPTQEFLIVTVKVHEIRYLLHILFNLSVILYDTNKY